VPVGELVADELRDRGVLAVALDGLCPRVVDPDRDTSDDEEQADQEIAEKQTGAQAPPARLDPGG
jgi:uncharacterized tellurite resistance protein B-like protein